MRDPRLVVLALLASANALALSLTGEVSPVGLAVPVLAGLALWRPPTKPRGPVFDRVFQVVAVGFLAWFLACLLDLRLLAGAAALTFPVQAHEFLQPPSLASLRRLQKVAFFQLVALAASTTAIFFGPLVLLHVALAPLAFTLGELEAAEGEPRRAAALPRGLAKAAAMASVGVLLVGALVFLALPRYEAGLMGQLRRPGQRLSGFSETVALGDITSIQASDEIVMRVRVRGQAPDDMRWRGIALDKFTGKEWSTTADAARVTARGGAWQVATPTPGMRRVTQEITIEPSPTRALFHLGTPTIVLPQNFRTVRADAWGNLQRSGETARRTRYEVTSGIGPNPEPLPEPMRAAFLQLPVLDSRVAALASETAGGGDDAQRAERLVRFLEARCTYALDVNDAGVEDPVSWFLFEGRRGHCEYFATVLTVMLRSAGIPARVVNGFQAGERSRLFGAYIVRQRDAHSWVEAWIPGRGWTTYDATPVSAEPPAALGDALEAWRQVEILWDDNVIGFNYTFQLGFLARMGEAADALLAWVRGHGATLRAVALGLLVLLAGIVLLLSVRRSRRPAHERRIAFYVRAARLLSRRGHRRRPSQTPWELAVDVAKSDPKVGEAALEITRLYYDARYGGAEPDPARVEELLRRLAA